MADLNGKDYVARVELTTRDGIVARVGERCDFVPVSSLPSLLALGDIAPVTADATAPAPKKAKR